MRVRITHNVCVGRAPSALKSEVRYFKSRCGSAWPLAASRLDNELLPSLAHLLENSKCGARAHAVCNPDARSVVGSLARSFSARMDAVLQVAVLSAEMRLRGVVRLPGRPCTDAADASALPYHWTTAGPRAPVCSVGYQKPEQGCECATAAE